jgi:hypothetical protein
MRTGFALFAVLTALSTLATGEHYLPDLAAALPWTWLMNRLALIIEAVATSRYHPGRRTGDNYAVKEVDA